MDLIKCFKCKHEVSSNASACPNCGVIINIATNEREFSKGLDLRHKLENDEDLTAKELLLLYEHLNDRLTSWKNNRKKFTFINIILKSMVAMFIGAISITLISACAILFLSIGYSESVASFILYFATAICGIVSVIISVNERRHINDMVKDFIIKIANVKKRIDHI